MADHSNADVLAAWLVHATQVGENGRLIPTESEISKILDERPAQFEVAHAIATAFVKRVVDTEPRSVIDATVGFVKTVHQLSEGKLGGLLSSPPPRPRQVGGRK